jgi:hypothetical protein
MFFYIIETATLTILLNLEISVITHHFTIFMTRNVAPITQVRGSTILFLLTAGRPDQKASGGGDLNVKIFVPDFLVHR